MHTYLEGRVKDVDTIRYSSADAMRKRGVTVYPQTKVLDIYPDKHQIKVRDLSTGEEHSDNYDRLILAVGAQPNIPKYADMTLENIYLYAGRDNAVALKEFADAKEIENVVIIGGGYIAVEAAISLLKQLKK